MDKFVGSFPTEFYNLRNLETLTIKWMNGLVGSITQEFHELKNLKKIEMSYNRFLEGSLTLFTNLTKLGKKVFVHKVCVDDFDY